jgi:hypothetical protein
VSIKLTLNGKEYVANIADLFTKMTIGEIRTIKRETGMTAEGLELKVRELKPDGDDVPQDEDWDIYTALVYLILSRSGGHIAWAAVEDLTLAEIAEGWSVVEDESPQEPVDLPAEIPLGELVVVDG